MQGSPATDIDADLRRGLRRHRTLATGLLAGMGGLLVGTYYMPPGYWTELLQASAKAGVVGGLADWFAVTALFRHPLGIPIPHTAIVPNHSTMTGPNRRPIAAVPRRWMANSPTSTATAIGTANPSSASVATSVPSTADSTEIAGVIIPSP